MTDKWAEYKKHFCTCKDAHRYNSCKGLLTCSLHLSNPERKLINFSDLKHLWNGRPNDKPMKRIECPVYVFDLSGRFGRFVHLNPNLYRPKDWRGLV